MLLHHPKSNAPVDCHPTQIEHMKSNGWVEEKPQKPPPKKQTKSETKPEKL